MRKNRLQFNMAINEEDRKVITELQNDYAVNVSQFLKLALRKHLEDVRKIRK